jgi:hypothetical protein
MASDNLAGGRARDSSPRFKGSFVTTNVVTRKMIIKQTSAVPDHCSRAVWCGNDWVSDELPSNFSMDP